MALATHENHADAPRQRPSPGVGMQGKAPVTGSTEAAKPVLIEDIDPILLVRLYAEAKDAGEMRAMAVAAGNATYEAGQTLVASQQEPVLGAGETPTPTPTPTPHPRRD